MPLVQKILFYSISAIILLLILVFVRKKLIREIDSWIWLIFALVLIILVSNILILEWLSDFLKVAKSVVIIFLSTIAFLILILRLYMISAAYHTRIKNLSQKIALLEEKVSRLAGHSDKDLKDESGENARGK
jgi:hypothetical protein